MEVAKTAPEPEAYSIVLHSTWTISFCNRVGFIAVCVAALHQCKWSIERSDSLLFLTKTNVPLGACCSSRMLAYPGRAVVRTVICDSVWRFLWWLREEKPASSARSSSGNCDSGVKKPGEVLLQIKCQREFIHVVLRQFWVDRDNRILHIEYRRRHRRRDCGHLCDCTIYSNNGIYVPILKITWAHHQWNLWKFSEPNNNLSKNRKHGFLGTCLKLHRLGGDQG